jgi:hypothetical protein
MRQDQQTSQTFVMLAMGLVTGAVAVGLYQHGGLPGPVAAATALAVYVVLLTTHALLWRGRTRPDRVAKDRRDQEVRRIAAEKKAPMPVEPSLTRRAAEPTLSSPAAAGHPLAPPVRASKEAIAASRAPSPRPVQGPAPQQVAPPPMPSLSTLSKDPLPAAAQAGATPAGDADFWSYRPASARHPRGKRRHQPRLPMRHQAEAMPPMPARPIRRRCPASDMAPARLTSR